MDKRPTPQLDRQQVVALVSLVALVTATLLDASFTFGEPPALPAAAVAPEQPAPPVVPERVLAQANIG